MASGSQPVDLAPSISPAPNIPQVAIFTISIPADTRVRVEFGPTIAYGRVTSWSPAPSGGGPVTILVAGMIASTTYHLRARVEWPTGKWMTTADQTFTAGAIPAIPLPNLSAITLPNQTPSPGVELVNVIDPTGISVVADLDGNILWYYDNPENRNPAYKGYAFPIKPLKNGNMLASITNLYSAGVPQTIPYNSVLREIDLAWNTVREISLADLNAALAAMGSDVQALCYSHDVLPLWNGHTILLAQQQKSVWLSQPPGPGQFTILGDALIDLDENFRPVWTWSAFDWLDVDRHPMGFTADQGYDWTHCNCVQLAPDGNLVLSSRHQSWVMKLTYAGGTGNGAVLWKLGYQGEFTLVGNATQPTDWFFAQHFPNILSASPVGQPERSEGSQITLISVFDNGNDRCYATPAGCAATNPPPPPPFSRGAMFTIDETKMQAALAWQYPLNEYSYWGGNVVQLLNGDVEICASEPVPIGAPQPPSDVPSQVVELTNGVSGPVAVWAMKISPGGTYRSYRIPSLYPGVIWNP